MRDVLRTLFSGRDNRSMDLGRWIWACFALALIGLETLSIARGGPFNPVEFATACGTIMALGGAGLAVKSHTEPSA